MKFKAEASRKPRQKYPLESILIILNVFLVISMFSLGFFSYPLALDYLESRTEFPFSLTGKVADSPSNFIEKDRIAVFSDRIVIGISGATISSYEDTGSMEPVLDENSNGIRVKPASEDEIQVGDIVSFRKNENLIVHRVIEKGSDSNGTYFITKGDSNAFNDGKIRFGNIEYITIGILY